MNKVWFVTGCSTGFGREICKQALQRGDKVIATARKVESVTEFEKIFPSHALAAAVDVTDRKSIQKAVDEGLKKFGRVDVLVNNAGYGMSGALEELTDEEMQNQFETNVFGVVKVTQALLPTFRKQKSGRILNISSMAGRIPVPTMGIYVASKHALEGLSESFALELQDFGIHVTILEPGGFITDFNGRSLSRATPMPEYDFLRDKMKSFIKGYVMGDTPTGVRTILKVADMENPPVRLVMGPNSYPRIMKKLTGDIEIYQAHEALWKESAENGTPHE